MKRPVKTDGFDAMINQDHAGAKEDPAEVIADMLCEETYLDHAAALAMAKEILTYIHEGFFIEN